jgi:hypothetical protein
MFRWYLFDLAGFDSILRGPCPAPHSQGPGKKKREASGLNFLRHLRAGLMKHPFHRQIWQYEPPSKVRHQLRALSVRQRDTEMNQPTSTTVPA